MRWVLGALLVSASLGASGCGADAARGIMSTCAESSECESGLCGGGFCLAPEGDEDLDGLVNAVEVALGSDPFARDSDGDGVDDGQELESDLGLRDTDGDGKPDILESTTADADGDCIPDQLDAHDDVSDSDLRVLLDLVCPHAGVCGAAGATLAVACGGGVGAKTARCVYDGVPGYEVEETLCDGLDNDCDGATDEADSVSGCAEVDACVAHPCGAHATCTDLPAPAPDAAAGRTCACEAGFAGDPADGCADIDGCAEAPCATDVACTDVAAPGTGRTCGACPAGQWGDGATCAACAVLAGCAAVTCTGATDASCATCADGYALGGDGACADIDECAGNTACGEHGTCVDGVDSFTCSCAAGFSGATCATNIDDCAGNAACGEHGTCVDGDDGFTCSCAAGFSGATCETNIDDCVGNTACGEHGTCVDGVDGFTCSCAAGFSGDTCGTNIDECAGNDACGEHGTCVDGDDGFSCSCAAGFSGATCETNDDLCASGPCASGETCTDTADGHICSCPGYTGDECDPDAPCGLLDVPCPTGFTCDRGLAAGTSYALGGAGGFCASDGSDEAFGEDASMIYVPPGTFWMGCNPALDASCNPTNGSEAPQHEVTLSAYAFDRVAVSAQAYWDWCGDNGFNVTANGWTGNCAPIIREDSSNAATYKPRTGTWTKQAHPANVVSHNQAIAYCEAHGKELCTEAQWERGARGGCETVSGSCQAAMRKFPWGNTEPTCAEANFNNCEPVSQTADVGSRAAGASPYGALNLSGSLWEWISDWYGSYSAGAVTDPQGPASGSNRVVRGGYFGQGASDIRASRRNWAVLGSAAAGVGFRCCRSYP